MGENGQTSEPASPSYSTNGLPLVPGLIELVTTNTAQTGGRHQGLQVGRVVIYAWPGQPPDPATQHSGAQWMYPENWLPYQKKTFVTPAFPGYISGHSTFSRAAAEVLAAITGTPFFPAGMGTYTAPAGTFLTFENGPSQAVQLQWGTYFDASDQAGLSRLWGGIHVSVDDLTGRRLGAECGQGVWALARQYFDGSVTNTPFALTIRQLNPTQSELRFDTLRGFYYKLQTTTNLLQSFADDPNGYTQAVDSSMIRIDALSGPNKFYRIARTPAP